MMGTSGSEPVVRFDINVFHVNLFKCNSAAKKIGSLRRESPIINRVLTIGCILKRCEIFSSFLTST